MSELQVLPSGYAELLEKLMNRLSSFASQSGGGSQPELVLLYSSIRKDFCSAMGLRNA